MYTDVLYIYVHNMWCIVIIHLHFLIINNKNKVEKAKGRQVEEMIMTGHMHMWKWKKGQKIIKWIYIFMTRLLSFLRTIFTFHSSFLRINNFLPSFRKFPFQPFFLLALLESWKPLQFIPLCWHITGWSCVRVYLPYRM